ncbi:MAG: Secretion system C-terminal sorting domain, partial [Bacteroidota bacterium]
NAATEINIIDMTGKTVYTETNNNSSIEINTSNFNKGLYMITVKNGVLSSTQTLSIQ